MLPIAALLLTAAAHAQQWIPQTSNSTASLRGISAVNDAGAVLLIEVEGRQGIARLFDCPPLPYEERKVAIVESALDVLAVERTSEFGGLYFVLHGVISPIDGIGPEQIHVPQLLDRVRDEATSEVIIATDADIEGEATALYLQRALQPFGARVTRPAHGLPVGGDLEYADELTLARAMAGRRTF